MNGTINYDGKIRFNGAYTGTLTFALDITFSTASGTQTEDFNYTSTIVSGGKTVTYTRSGSDL